MADIYLSQHILDAMIAQARAEAPLEACGMLSGNGRHVRTLHRMTNGDRSEDHFSLVPEEQFAVAKRVRTAHEEMLAVYHSHPASPARPSAEDIRLAFMPDILYVILSLLKPDNPDVKGFRLNDGEVIPVALEINSKP